MAKTVDEVMVDVSALSDELQEYYYSILKKHKLDEADKVVSSYREEVKANDGQLSNDRIRYYLGMFSYYFYELNAKLGGHAMRRDIAELLQDSTASMEYLMPTLTVGDAVVKTREDKLAASKMNTIEESKVKILYKVVSVAVEARIKAFGKLMDSLTTMSAMNMSEAKLGGK